MTNAGVDGPKPKARLQEPSDLMTTSSDLMTTSSDLMTTSSDLIRSDEARWAVKPGRWVGSWWEGWTKTWTPDADRCGRKTSFIWRQQNPLSRRSGGVFFLAWPLTFVSSDSRAHMRLWTNRNGRSAMLLSGDLNRRSAAFFVRILQMFLSFVFAKQSLDLKVSIFGPFPAAFCHTDPLVLIRLSVWESQHLMRLLTSSDRRFIKPPGNLVRAEPEARRSRRRSRTADRNGGFYPDTFWSRSGSSPTTGAPEGLNYEAAVLHRLPPLNRVRLRLQAETFPVNTERRRSSDLFPTFLQFVKVSAHSHHSSSIRTLIRPSFSLTGLGLLIL